MSAEIGYNIWSGFRTSETAASGANNPTSGSIKINRTLESGETYKRLMLDDVYDFAAEKSLRNMDDTAYTVPTGHTAKLIMTVRQSLGSSGQTVVYETGTVDDITGGTIKYNATSIAELNLSSQDLLSISPEWHQTEKTFAAGKYITLTMANAGDTGSVLNAMVIEAAV
jgi:hypothetical protein